MFTERDLRQIAAHGLTPERIALQIERFGSGFPFLPVLRAASAGDGIEVLGAERAARYAERFRGRAGSLGLVKFVPASGAATRMFKELYEFLGEGRRGEGVDTLLASLDRFAFAGELRRMLPPAPSDREVISAIVGPGLEYGSKPKGLVLFHRYPDQVRTAVEEHLVEAALYAASQGEARLHFTVSPEHRAGFEALIARVAPRYGERYGVRYRVEFSEQAPSTDTIAVDTDNRPFRNADGTLLFRPAGHGALLENLNGIDADIVFIKNIDNVTVDRLRSDTVTYKMALAGLLLELQEQTFAALRDLQAGADAERVRQIARFVEQRLCNRLPADWDAALLARLLDRPLRVCGMVRNDGEPGGGPFWVRDAQGVASLQIAESSQIAPADAHLMRAATHFNPVDLVCGVRRADGTKFDLSRYTDPSTGFISTKSKEGRQLRAQELPGLWNGAMAQWNTLFVEVPASTFSPVKTVNDLLRPQHQQEF